MKVVQRHSFFPQGSEMGWSSHQCLNPQLAETLVWVQWWKVACGRWLLKGLELQWVKTGFNWFNVCLLRPILSIFNLMAAVFNAPLRYNAHIHVPGYLYTTFLWPYIAFQLVYTGRLSLNQWYSSILAQDPSLRMTIYPWNPGSDFMAGSVIKGFLCQIPR